jgi:hypothetical protein
MSLDNALWLTGVVVKASLIAVLAYKCVWRKLPIFCLYCIWDILLDSGNFAVRRYVPDSYLTFYLFEIALDALFQFSVLVELAWSVLRPIRKSLPRASVFIISCMILAVGALIWPFSDIYGGDAPQQMHILMHLMQTVSILRILIFLALAGSSQLLSLSWRDRELQVATGLGVFSIVSMGVAMIQSHQHSTVGYGHLVQFVVAGYVFSLVYWLVCFSQREAERQEFTPQMQNLLLAMAGVARADREALVNQSVTTERERRTL